MNKNDLYKDLLEHWQQAHSWRGLPLSTVKRMYGVDREKTLEMMRQIAHTHRAYDAKYPVCRSCGMQIIFMIDKTKDKKHPCDGPIKLTLTIEGFFKHGRESHYTSCPDAEAWRERQKDGRK